MRSETVGLVDAADALMAAARKLSMDWAGGVDETDRENAVAVALAIDAYDDAIQRTADVIAPSTPGADVSEALAQIKPYYDDGLCVIYHGDCEEILPSLGLFDIAVTSPPYNMGLVPGGNGRGMYRPGANNKGGRFRAGYTGDGDDALPQEEYDAWQRRVLAAMWEHVRRAIFYNHRPRVEHGKLRVPLSFDYGLPLRQIIVWDRGTGIDVNLRAFCTRQEWVLLFAKPEFTLVDHAASGMGDVWRLGIETAVPTHPAPFPVALPARAIAATGAASVVDPFLGSGSTLVAAKSAGIRAVGIEKHEPYCEIAAKRLAQGVLALAEEQTNGE